MTYELIPMAGQDAIAGETAEYRLTHYRVYDEDGFASSFSTNSPEGATLESVTAYVIEKYHGKGGMGYQSKDLVILLGTRIVAVVRKGTDQKPVVTKFEV